MIKASEQQFSVVCEALTIVHSELNLSLKQLTHDVHTHQVGPLLICNYDVLTGELYMKHGS